MVKERRLEIGSSVLDIGCSKVIVQPPLNYQQVNEKDGLNVQYRTRNVQ